MPSAPASSIRETSALSGATTVTRGVSPLSRASTRKFVRVSPLWTTCSVSTRTMSNPAIAAILTTDGLRDSKTFMPTTGRPAFSFSFAGLLINGLLWIG